MSDLFHEDVPFSYIENVFNVMRLANWHTYQVLTKRASRMLEFSETVDSSLINQPHIWLGTSVEDRKFGLPRVPILRQVPASTRFLSVEPLLEALGQLELEGIHWVIVGGESGLGARPLSKDWVISIRDQCAAKSVPFFFKQWGGLKKKILGRELEGRTYNEFPKTPKRKPPAIRQRERYIIEAERAWALSA